MNDPLLHYVTCIQDYDIVRLKKEGGWLQSIIMCKNNYRIHRRKLRKVSLRIRVRVFWFFEIFFSDSIFLFCCLFLFFVQQIQTVVIRQLLKCEGWFFQLVNFYFIQTERGLCLENSRDIILQCAICPFVCWLESSWELTCGDCSISFCG